MDGASGRLDPAFDAHAGPFKYWCLALWESWFSVDALQAALDQAVAKLDRAKESMSSAVVGPVAALVATFVLRFGQARFLFFVYRSALPH